MTVQLETTYDQTWFPSMMVVSQIDDGVDQESPCDNSSYSFAISTFPFCTDLTTPGPLSPSHEEAWDSSSKISFAKELRSTELSSSHRSRKVISPFPAPSHGIKTKTFKSCLRIKTSETRNVPTGDGTSVSSRRFKQQHVRFADHVKVGVQPSQVRSLARRNFRIKAE